MKISLKFLSIVIVVLGIIALPACKRTALKPLPPIPAKAEKTAPIHVESHLLTHDECNDYLNLSFDKKSGISAWHVIIYNTTEQSIYLNSNSWDIQPLALLDIEPLIQAKAANYSIIVLGGLSSYVLFAISGVSFIYGLFPVYRDLWLWSLALTTGISSIGTVIGTYFISRSITNSSFLVHREQLIQQLFPLACIIRSKSAIQGIVLLPKETTYQSWNITLFDEQHEQLHTQIINS